MKIAIVSSLFPPYAIGGAEILAGQLAAALDHLGHRVDVITTCRPASLDSRRYLREDWDGVRVWRIAPWNVYWGYDRQRERPGRLARACWHAVDLWNPSVIGPLREVLGEVRPEVVNTHNIDGFSPAVWKVAREFTPAIAHTLHDCHLLCPRATMRRGDGTVCESLCGLCSLYASYHLRFQKYVPVLISPALANAQLHQDAGWRGPRLEMIRNGVDISPLPHLAPAPADPLRVLFLSRLEREKGCGTLLAAMTALSGSGEIEFHVAGAGSMERPFTDLAGRMSNATWHGFVTGRDKDELFSRCDVFLQLSECRENAPLSLNEAKAHGLYLLGTAVGGIPEVVGHLIPPGDRRALVLTLQELSRSRTSIRAGRSLRAEQNGGYGTRQMAEAYVEAFCSLIAPAITNAATSQG